MVLSYSFLAWVLRTKLSLIFCRRSVRMESSWTRIPIGFKLNLVSVNFKDRMPSDSRPALQWQALAVSIPAPSTRPAARPLTTASWPSSPLTWKEATVLLDLGLVLHERATHQRRVCGGKTLTGRASPSLLLLEDLAIELLALLSQVLDRSSPGHPSFQHRSV